MTPKHPNGPDRRKWRVSAVPALFLLLVSIPCVAAPKASEAEIYKVDSVLYAYYQQCKEHIFSPAVLAMADTLFDMAKQKGDKRMQAVALSTVVDHYYFNNQEDSLLVCVERVKDFARKTQQPKYYYFAWGKRLVQYYIKTGKVNTAFNEVEKMLAQAHLDDDKEGLANCYYSLAVLYKLQGMIERAGESRLKEVELIERYDLDRYNLTLAWIDIADYYNKIGDEQKMLEAARKAEEAALTAQNQVTCMNFYMNYYARSGRLDIAREYLDSMETLFGSDRRLESMFKMLYAARVNYFSHTGQYDRALQAVDDRERELERLGEEGMMIHGMRNKASIYLQSGDYQKSARLFEQYFILRDSVDLVRAQTSAGEFAAMLDVERLNSQKQELELQAREQKFHYISILSVVLIICLGGVSLLFVRWYRLGRRLELSQKELLQKNEALVESRAEALAASERAELANRMKSVFIQNMTHEIRTPLNAIVGFSRLISEIASQDSEMRQYTEIIENNNYNLLKLIDQVLDLSDLESGKGVELAPVNIESCCRDAVKEARIHLNEGVKMEFIPPDAPIRSVTDGKRVEQILLNLLQNACRATATGKITLACALEGDPSRVVFSVTDTGIGIPEDKREEIFARFMKLDDFSQGSGLGLSICRMLAEKMGGSLIVDETYTRGARLILTIPYLPA